MRACLGLSVLSLSKRDKRAMFGPIRKSNQTEFKYPTKRVAVLNPLHTESDASPSSSSLVMLIPVRTAGPGR